MPEDKPAITLSSIALPVLAVAAAAVIFYYAAPILIPMTIAAATAYTLSPVVTFLKRLKMPNVVAVTIVMLLLLGIGVLLAAIFISEAVQLAGALPEYQEETIDFFNQAKNWLADYLNQFPGLFPDMREFKLNPIYLSGAGKILFKGVGSLTSLGFSAVLLFFLTYFMLLDYEMLVEKLRVLFGADKRHATSAILDQVSHQLRGFITVKLLVTAGMAIVLTLGLLILDIPYAYIWGPLAAVLNLIPYVGAFIGSIPPIAIAGIVEGSIAAMIPVAVLFLAVQILESYVVTPRLTSDTIDLNPLTVLLSSIIWGYLWGAIGVVLAIPITAAAKVFCDNIEPLKPIGILLGGKEKPQAA